MNNFIYKLRMSFPFICLFISLILILIGDKFAYYFICVAIVYLLCAIEVHLSTKIEIKDLEEKIKLLEYKNEVLIDNLKALWEQDYKINLDYPKNNIAFSELSAQLELNAEILMHKMTEHALKLENSLKSVETKENK